MADTKEVKIKLKRIYPAACMLTNVKVNLTFHHCPIKREHGGRETVENGALLTERIHCGYLHSVLEKHCPFCFNEVNLLIQRYKQALDENDEEYIQWHYDNVFPRFLKILESRYIIGKGKCKKRKRVKK